MNTLWVICFSFVMKFVINLFDIKKDYMIKKLLNIKLIYVFFWLLIFSIFNINKSFAWQVREIWPYPGASPYDKNIDIAVLSKWTLNSSYLWTARKIFAFASEVKDNWNNWTMAYIWWNNWLPYIYSNLWSNYNTPNNYRNDFYQWVPKYYYICPSALNWTEEDYNFQNCSLVEITDWSREVLKNFFDNVVTHDYYYFDYQESYNYWNPYQWFSLCFSSSWLNRTVCFRGGCSPRSVNSACIELTDSLWIPGKTNFYDINQYYLWDSPAVDNNFNWWWNTENITWASVTIESDIADYINYYESRFNWNVNMCYIWTDRVNKKFWDNVEFTYWTWFTLYQFYYYLYWSFWDNKIKNVWTFINTWLINYSQWFDIISEENRLYLASYNWPWTNISLYYTGLSNPFEWKSIWYYFMSDLLYNQFSVESTMWEEMIYYCDMKLNYDSYVNWNLDFWDLKNSVTPWINKRVDDYVNDIIKWNNWYSVPSSWSVWDNLILSGNSIPQDLNPTNLFKDFYDRINWLLVWFNPWRADWIIPRWILFPMLFLILFRILKH